MLLKYNVLSLCNIHYFVEDVEFGDQLEDQDGMLCCNNILYCILNATIANECFTNWTDIYIQMHIFQCDMHFN